MDKKQCRKSVWKVAKKILYPITCGAVIAMIASAVVLVFAYSQEYATEIPLAVCLSCLGWLGLMKALYLLGKHFGF